MNILTFALHNKFDLRKIIKVTLTASRNFGIVIHKKKNKDYNIKHTTI